MKKMQRMKLRKPTWKEVAVGSLGVSGAVVERGIFSTLSYPGMMFTTSGAQTLGQLGPSLVQPVVIAEAVVLGAISIYEAIKYLKRHYGYSETEAVHELHKHISTIKKSSDNRLRKVS